MMKLPAVLRGKTILLVDPDPDSARRMRGLLAQYGLQVHAVGTGLEARNLVRRMSYDLVLLVAGPGREEWAATIRGLRRRHSGGTLPLVALVDDDAWPDGRSDSLSGIDAVVAKPVHVPGLITTLASLLGCARGETTRPFDAKRFLDKIFGTARESAASKQREPVDRRG